MLSYALFKPSTRPLHPSNLKAINIAARAAIVARVLLELVIITLGKHWNRWMCV